MLQIHVPERQLETSLEFVVYSAGVSAALNSFSFSC